MNENALSPPEREKLRSAIPVREHFETVEAYQQARRDAGLDCANCGTLIYFPERKGRTFCTSCLQRTKTEKWYNSRAIRCPKCAATHDTVMQHTEYIQWFTCMAGDLTWNCHCGHRFTVTVELSYDFISPALLSDESQE